MNSKQSYAAMGMMAFAMVAAIAGYAWLSPPLAPRVDAGAKSAIDPTAPVPMFGGSPSRNMVNLVDKNPPVSWNAEKGKLKNIKWTAQLGNHAYGGPVVADGKVFVGTTNTSPRDPKITGRKAVLMAFDEKDGKYLWQIVHDFPNDDIFKDSQITGLVSTPVVEGKLLYYVTPACEIVCADTSGIVQWTYDMMKELKVIPHHCGNCSPLIVGDLLMIVTSNGVNEDGKVASPKAPSFIAFNKKTRKVVWQSDLPGTKIIEGQWSNPALAVVNGKPQVIFPGGDNYLYAFEPETGKLIWKCNVNPSPAKKDEREKMTNYIISTPVVVGDRVYVGLGVYPEHHHPTRHSYIVCVDVTKTGDVSPVSLDAKDPANQKSALVWAFGGPINPPPKDGRQVYFGRTVATAAVHDGLLYITEEMGYLHCLDAKTGKRLWEHDFKESIVGSPYYVDGKVYVGNQGGDVIVFAHGKECKYYIDGKRHDASPANYRKLPTATMEENGVSTPVVANGVLYIMTTSKLYAIAEK